MRVVVILVVLLAYDTHAIPLAPTADTPTWCGMMVACGDPTHDNCAGLLAGLNGRQCRPDLDEAYAVRCCSNRRIEGFTQVNGCNVWSASQMKTNWTAGDGEAATDWSHCYHDRTWSTAADICAGAGPGSRLCTRDEVERRCTADQKCAQDGSLVWTSSGNACMSMPCNARGDFKAFCTDTMRRDPEYTCSCSTGFAGTLCDFVPCPANSTRTEHSGACFCDLGYEGTISWDPKTGTYIGSCKDADGCQGSPCNKKGDDAAVCHDAPAPAPPGAFTCACSVGFKGPQCDFDGCLSKPCQQHDDVAARCTEIVDVDGGYKCSCSPGYDGTVCALTPCPPYSYMLSPATCRCEDGFSGSVQWGGQGYVGACIPASACSTRPCNQNGDQSATCVDVISPAKGSICTCSSGYVGATCSPINSSDNNNNNNVTAPLMPSTDDLVPTLRTQPVAEVPDRNWSPPKCASLGAACSAYAGDISTTCCGGTVCYEETACIAASGGSSDGAITTTFDAASTHSKFRQMAAFLDSLPAGQLKAGFDAFDVDHDGRLTARELTVAFPNMMPQFQLSMAELARLMALVDSNSDGKMSLKEVVAALATLAADTPQDAASSSRISLQPDVTPVEDTQTKFQRLFKILNTLTPEQLVAGFHTKDLNHDNQVSTKELLAMLPAVLPNFSFTADEVDMLMRLIDSNGDGKMTMQEAWQGLNKSLSQAAAALASASVPADTAAPAAQAAPDATETQAKFDQMAAFLNTLPPAQLQAGFDVFDEDHDGRLTAAELIAGFPKVLPQFKMTDAEVALLMGLVDANGDGKMSLPEVAAALAAATASTAPADAVSTAPNASESQATFA